MNVLKYDQLWINGLNNKEKRLLEELFTYRSVFLSSIISDTTNARFLPVILIEDEHARQFVSRK